MADSLRELEKFSEELQAFIAPTEKKIITALEDIEKRCMDNSREDADRYAECMTKNLKRIEKEENRFQYRIGFMQHRLHECLNRQDPIKNSEFCKSEAKASLEKYIDDLIKNIKM